MFVLKLAEVGAGPTIAWSTVGGSAVIGVFLIILDVVLLFKFRPTFKDVFNVAAVPKP